MSVVKTHFDRNHINSVNLDYKAGKRKYDLKNNPANGCLRESESVETFQRAYPNATFQQIHQDNYLDFILEE